MQTYPGMSLGGEVREREVSIDDDDLSDVEDEVFVRNGTNGYKFSKDFGVKRPLMAPKRRIKDLILEDKNSRSIRFGRKVLKIMTILTVICGSGLFIFGVFRLSPKIYKEVRSYYERKYVASVKLLPCSHLKVTDVWSVTLPKLTSESSIRALDIDNDGVEDLIFGFGTNDNTELKSNVFCPMFMGVESPCGGGVIALNGKTGSVMWKKHMPYTIFGVFCSADLNNDTINDCLITGRRGILVAVNAKDGNVIWQYDDKINDVSIDMNVYSANFIPDQDNDDVMDVLAGHVVQKGFERSGNLILISGKSGIELQLIATPNDVETFFTPQILPKKDGNDMVIVGTGSPSSQGNLSVFPLKSLTEGNITFQTVYQDTYKGILSPCVLVDLNDDGQLDIVSAMFNSTVVAIDGNDYRQLWNFTVNSSETLSLPIPGYFNDDNVVDFLVKYQTGTEFPTYYYSQTFIIDGKTGRPIYEKPIVDSVGSQVGGVTLSMNGSGRDYFLYWMADCDGYEGQRDFYEFLPGGSIKTQDNADLCKLRFNSTKTTKLYALNQFNQPPGLKIYASDERKNLEYNNSRTPVEEALDFVKAHPQFRIADDNVDDDVVVDQDPEIEVPLVVQGDLPVNEKSPFRHKYDDQGIIKPFNEQPPSIVNEKILAANNPELPDYDPSLAWTNYQNQNLDDIYNPYSIDEDQRNYPRKNILNEDLNVNRDVRGDDEIDAKQEQQQQQQQEHRRQQKTLKKNLSDGIYGYKNVRQSKNRLLHDLNSTPTEILKDTYFKNMERQLRKSRLEQRDIKSHVDKIKENEDVKNLIDDAKKKLMNTSESLWDLETEKEREDRDGYWRGKRDVKTTPHGVPRTTSVGTVVKSFDTNANSIDLVFLTYWTPPTADVKVFLEKDTQCVDNKIKKALNSKENIIKNYQEVTLSDQFKKECVDIRLKQTEQAKPSIKFRTKPNLPYYNKIAQLSLGQMTVYRIRIECSCEIKRTNEVCTNFLSATQRGTWTAHLNQRGNGVFINK